MLRKALILILSLAAASCVATFLDPDLIYAGETYNLWEFYYQRLHWMDAQISSW